MKTYQNYVHGKMVDAVEGQKEPIISPVDESILGQVPKGTEKDVDRAVDAAAAAFETWQDTTPGGKMSPASSMSRREVSGVCSEGFRTTVFPAASAGPTFQTAIMSG